MGMSRVQFARQYRAAMLDYLLGSGESGRARAYLLGRRAVGADVGLLQIVRVHQDAVMAVVGAKRAIEDVLRELEVAHEFLVEVLAAFEMTSRGYVDLVGSHRL